MVDDVYLVELNPEKLLFFQYGLKHHIVHAGVISSWFVEQEEGQIGDSVFS